MITWAVLDRDGTINVPAPAGAYVTDPHAVRLMSGTADAIRQLNVGLGAVVVVTNQRGIARGILSRSAVERINERINELLLDAGARVDRFLVCPHEVGVCECRKPGPRLLYEASREVGLSVRNAVMIGDSESDVEAGLAAGAQTIRITRPGATTAAGATVPTLAAAAKLVLGGWPAAERRAS